MSSEESMSLLGDDSVARKISKLDKIKAFLHLGKSADAVLARAIDVSNNGGTRTWELPGKVTAGVTVIKGAGGLAEGILDAAIGESPKVKELVPMSPQRWGKWVSTVTAGPYLAAIPGANFIVAPIMAAAQKLFEGGSKKGAARKAGQAAGSAGIDTVIDAATFGGYAIYQLCTAWIVALGTIFTRAHNYKETYTQAAAIINGNIVQFQSVVTAQQDKMSAEMRTKCDEQIRWLQEQSRKCMERGESYRAIALEYERKFDDAVNRAREMMGGEVSEERQRLLDNAH